MNVRNLVLGVGIFIVYLLMVSYGIEAFYPSPQYDQYCTALDYTYPAKYPMAENCSFSLALQQEADRCSASGGNAIYNYDVNGCYSSIKECDMCNTEFNDAQKEYSKTLFIIALIVGIITLIVGFAILSMEPVGSALMASGIGAIVYGSIRNWQNLSDILRFALLVVALVLLIWITIRANSKKKSWMFWKK